jgi:hypothetical protein
MNPALDINTPRGRISVQDQHRAAAIVFRNRDGFDFISTADDDSSAVDGFIVREFDGPRRIVTGVAEIKSRNASYETLMGSFGGEWLLTHQKLLDIQSVSRLLRVTGYGFLFLKQSGCVLVVTLTNADGAIVCKHREDRTETQATCNGGTATRENSYIDVIGAMVYREHHER